VTSNAPPFDPLHPSPAEADDMVAGYQDGIAGRPPRDDGSIAYAHGRRNGINDRAGTADPEQRELARRMLRERVH
jgi:hypothetical protein